MHFYKHIKETSKQKPLIGLIDAVTNRIYQFREETGCGYKPRPLGLELRHTECAYYFADCIYLSPCWRIATNSCRMRL